MQEKRRPLPKLDAVRHLTSGVELTVHIVCADWHRNYVDEAVNGAIDCLSELSGITSKQCSEILYVNAQDPKKPMESLKLRVVKHRVSGTWEIMARISSLVHSRELDLGHVCYLAIGAVLRGETSHYDHLCNSVYTGIANLIVSKDAVIAAGILTCDTEEQLAARAEDKGRDAMESAFVEMWRRIGGRATYHSPS